MSVIDILFRVDTICKKYEKYDIEKMRSSNSSVGDAFAHLYASFESQIEAALHKSEVALMETNRAAVVEKNAEVRRLKARLLKEVPKLQKLAQKKYASRIIPNWKKLKGYLEKNSKLVVTWLSHYQREFKQYRMEPQMRLNKLEAGELHHRIKSLNGHFDDDFFQHSEETSKFRQEYEMRKLKQDQGLDFISEGLDTLKNLALDMNEELDRQVPLIDEIDTKVDKATSNIRNTNVRLKETVLKVRSTKDFCIDIILLCVILGIAAYLYNILR